MFRNAPPGFSPADPLLLVPGLGFRGVIVGGATPKRVLAMFGDDAKRHTTPAGDLVELNYNYTKNGDYLPDRPCVETVPEKFHFSFGLLHAIEIGVYQRQLYTEGGVRIRSKRDDVIAAFGSEFDEIAEESFDVLRYIGRGIEISIARDDFGVTSLMIFREQRTSETAD